MGRRVDEGQVEGGPAPRASRAVDVRRWTRRRERQADALPPTLRWTLAGRYQQLRRKDPGLPLPRPCSKQPCSPQSRLSTAPPWRRACIHCWLQHERGRCNDQIDGIFPKSRVNSAGIGAGATAATRLPQVLHREICRLAHGSCTPWRCREITASLHHCITASLHHCITVSLHGHVVASRRHRIDASPHLGS